MLCIEFLDKFCLSNAKLVPVSNRRWKQNEPEASNLCQKSETTVHRAHQVIPNHIICPSQDRLDNKLRQPTWQTWKFVNTIFQIMENFYGRVVVGDDPCVKKNPGAAMKMGIEVRANIFREVIPRTSKLRKWGVKLGEKPTTEGQKYWIDMIKTKSDGK